MVSWNQWCPWYPWCPGIHNMCPEEEQYQKDVHIYSASWGPDDDGRTVDGPGPLTRWARDFFYWPCFFLPANLQFISLLVRWATKLGNVISASDHGKFCQESPGGGGNNWKRGQRLHICLGKWQWGQVLTYF